MTSNSILTKQARAWVKRKNGPGEIVFVVLDTESNNRVTGYLLYTAFEANPDYLGRILFDSQGFWIYDGDILAVAEQEQLARFIIGHMETNREEGA